MPKIIVLPHPELCPEGDVIEAKQGESICNTLLKNHIDLNTPAIRYVRVQPVM